MEVFISHYKSIEKAQMKLGRITVLLGPPAAGKSNLREAIALATYFDRYAFYIDGVPYSRDVAEHLVKVAEELVALCT